MILNVEVEEKKPEPTCRRLGKCCHYLGENNEVKRCKFLVGRPGFFRCRIYNSRIGTVIDKIGDTEIRCGWRSDSPFNFIGCDYNRLHPDKPVLKIPGLDV